MLINIVIETPQVELVASNRYGKMFLTSEGYHINGDRRKFINSIQRDLRSGDCIAEINARIVLNYIQTLDEI